MDRDNLTLRGLVALTVPVSVTEQKAGVCAQAFPDPCRSGPPTQAGRIWW